MRIIGSLSAITLALTTVSVVASAKLDRQGEPTVEFTALGPVGLKIHGETHELSIVDRGADVSIKVPLSGLKTGISLRDSHMRDKYLEVGKFPFAELQVARANLKLPTGNGQASGTMNIHGKSRGVSFHYDAKQSGDAIHVKGTVRLNIKDFGIDVPSYAGVTVKPDIDVAVEFDAKDH